ncbi:hypothetical protein KCU65_g6517, partial [Aureobasidium melanogenum]
MFLYWLGAFNTEVAGSGLAAMAARLGEKMYGSSHTGWSGTLTHSPLTEQLGTEESGGVRQARFQEHMSALHDEYGDDIPEEMVEMAWRRSRFDNVSQNQGRTNRRNNQSASKAAEEKAKDKARKAKRMANQTANSKAEEAAYHVTYVQNKKAQMTEEELAEFREKNRLKQTKSRAKKKARRAAGSR